MSTEKREPRRRMAMTEERKQLMLDELRVHGVIREACRVASPGSSHLRGAEQSFRDEMARDPEFRRQVEEAVEDSKAALEMEIFRRGVLGYEEERIDPAGRVTILRRYSDALILARARALLPGYAKNDVQLSGTVEHKDDTLAAAVRDVASQIASGVREAGQGEVDRILAERGLASAN